RRRRSPRASSNAGDAGEASPTSCYDHPGRSPQTPPRTTDRRATDVRTRRFDGDRARERDLPRWAPGGARARSRARARARSRARSPLGVGRADLRAARRAGHWRGWSRQRANSRLRGPDRAPTLGSTRQRGHERRRAARSRMNTTMSSDAAPEDRSRLLTMAPGRLWVQDRGPLPTGTQGEPALLLLHSLLVT